MTADDEMHLWDLSCLMSCKSTQSNLALFYFIFFLIELDLIGFETNLLICDPWLVSSSSIRLYWVNRVEVACEALQLIQLLNRKWLNEMIGSLMRVAISPKNIITEKGKILGVSDCLVVCVWHTSFSSLEHSLHYCFCTANMMTPLVEEEFFLSSPQKQI